MDYSVSVLGDTHFDASPTEAYHASWVPRDAADAGDRAGEFARNAEMWRERMPRLVAAAASTARRAGSAALLHVGDLVQGDCGDDATRLRYLSDAKAACTRGFPDIPFLVVPGNHDLRGGGENAWTQWAARETAAAAQAPFAIGPDAFVFADFMRPDPDALFAALDASAGARRVFLVTHGTVAPPDVWGPYWFLFGEPELSEARRELFRRLLALNAVVICGHLHRVSVRRWVRPEGSVVEFCANSVWRPGWENPRSAISSPERFGSYVRDNPPPVGEAYDGRRNARTPQDLLALVDEYRAGLVEYSMKEAAGHFLLRVSDRDAAVDFFPGDSDVPAETFNLQPPSAGQCETT